jgi:hypothetical protein
MKPVTDWQKRYEEGKTGWDIGYVSPPLKAYFDQLENKELRILIPGAGNGYEVAYLHQQGFTNVTLLDIASAPLQNFKSRHPDFPDAHLLQENFFEHKGSYDLIIEQTFFCAISPAHRQEYVSKVHSLLAANGKLVGLFWSVPMNEDEPPFGGNKEEYLGYLKPYFKIKSFDTAYNSIPPRQGRELFLIAEKKS